MEKTVEFYNEVIQYFKLNHINLGFVLLFAGVGFLIAELIKHKIKRRINKKSPNPLTATFISQIIGFVKDINIREIQIKTPDGKDVFLPNSQVMNNVVAALIAKGFSLPACVIELKNYDPSIPLNLKIETNE